MLKHIPNFITCLNLICGCLGIVAVFEGDLDIASYWMWLGAFFDFIDGFIARLFKANSELGKQLDSLSDVVTFGVLPGMIMMHLIKQSIFHKFLSWDTPLPYHHLEYLAFLIPAFSALRLARFNLDTRQTVDFIGLPTPANGLFLSSFPLILVKDTLGISELILDYRFLIAVTLIFSFLLVSELRLFSLKFKSFSFKDNKIKYIFLAISLVLGFIFNYSAIPIIVVLYITLSLVQQYILKT